MKNVLILGASGLIMPHVIPSLEPHYTLLLTDVKPHPAGLPVQRVDVSDYQQVYEAMAGMDAVINATVVRNEPERSFSVNTLGANNVMKAAATLGIRKVIHTGPQLYRNAYDEDFGIANPPLQPDTGFYGLTKYLSYEICKVYARTYAITTPCFVFNGLGARPESPRIGQDFPPMTVLWEDLQHACRLALELEGLPNYFHVFHLHSYEGHSKFLLDDAKRLLGFEPQQRWMEDYRRKR